MTCMDAHPRRCLASALGASIRRPARFLYDRPFDDILMVRDDIAGEVTKTLRASIEARPGH